VEATLAPTPTTAIAAKASHPGRLRAARPRPAFQMSLSERLLVARLVNRDEEAFDEVVRQHGDRVFNLVLRMVGSRAEAEDIAQEVFVTVFKSIDTFRSEAKLSTWLLRIATNHAKNRIKYLARRREQGSEPNGNDSADLADEGKAPAQSHIHGPDVLLEAAETEDIMQQAIATLDDDQRLLIVLRDVEELSYEEIVQITGLPEGTVKSRLHRARMTLKQLLEDKLK
jgi:RNA polymerase sigma-70 factor (ECF subfamily)